MRRRHNWPSLCRQRLSIVSVSALVLLAGVCMQSARAGLPPQSDATEAAQAQPRLSQATAAAIDTARKDGIELKLEALPASAWDVLTTSAGIPFGLEPGKQANVQVIFDTNCDYCAKLYLRMQDEPFVGIATRWVPVAFMKQDSAAIANALLASNDPARSLDAFFRSDKAKRNRGDILPSHVMQSRHEPDYAALMKKLGEWGGYTPMIIIRTAAGEVLRVQHDQGEVLRRALDLAGAAPDRAFVGGADVLKTDSSRATN